MTSISPSLRRRVDVVREGLERLRDPLYGGFNIPDEVLEERARNIVTALLAEEMERW